MKKNSGILFILVFGFLYALLTLVISDGKVDETLNQLNFGFIIALLLLIYLEIKRNK
jgi:vacuolar-type H+-ATPase subunit I/STV1